MTQLLNAQGIRKDYGATRALDSVDIAVDRGQVVALLGANGSGKSSLTRILTGAASSNAGQIDFDGTHYAPRSPQIAQRAGVVAVAQELSLVPNMTVAQNIWLGAQRLLPRGRGSIAMRQAAATVPLLELFSGVQREVVNPHSLISDLSPDECQIVEILKALARSPKLLILDEATSTLDRSQVARLFEHMRSWCAQGMGIVFVSHRMDEVFTVSNAVCVVRTGRTVLLCPIDQVTHESVISAMTGAVDSLVPAESTPHVVRSSKVLLSLTAFRAEGIQPTDMQLHRGEIVGLGGLQRQGQGALLRAVSGAGDEIGGELRVDGRKVSVRTPRDSMRLGIHYVAGDRKELALGQRPILENLLASSWPRFRWLFSLSGATKAATEFADKLHVKRAGLGFPLSSLSGGNAQKVLFARALINDPQILILNDPTKGVDVMTKKQIYGTLRELQAEGRGILLYSSEDEELLDLADRVVVFHDGAAVTELSGARLTKQNLVAASMGVRASGSEVADDVR